MSSTLFRAGAASAAAAAIFLAGASFAWADSASESYVATNATEAIGALSASGSPIERSEKFGALMEQFTDFPAITDFVLGAYARTLRGNPALKEEWTSTFRDYAMATYEDQLDRYRGSALKITGSRDSVRNSKQCSAVGTVMTRKSAEPLKVNWYLCRPVSGGEWKVTDVGLVLGDSELKLAITQRDQFVAFLGSNGGDIQKLIERVKTQTAAMRTRITAKRT